MPKRQRFHDRSLQFPPPRPLHDYPRSITPCHTSRQVYHTILRQPGGLPNPPPPTSSPLLLASAPSGPYPSASSQTR